MKKLNEFNKIFIGGRIREDLNDLENKLIKYGDISGYGFKDENEANEWINKFPKYVKIKKSYISSGFDSKNKEIGFEFYISNITNVTGEINETGLKRIKAFLKVLGE